MHQAVKDSFLEFSKRFEGCIYWMYLDIKGLVTTGIGNLINTEDTVAALPFFDKLTNQPASRSEILAEWNELRHLPELALKGYKACDAVTQLRLSNDAVEALVKSKLESNERFLMSVFPDWEAWPADAQLGVSSMAWALGAGFSNAWPKFTAACRAGDWHGAAEQCTLKEQGNPGVIPRNVANRLLFHNAATVVSSGLDASKLYYPQPAAAMPARQGLA